MPKIRMIRNVAFNGQVTLLRPKKLQNVDPEQAYYWTDARQGSERRAESDIRAGRIRKLSLDNLDA